MILRLLYIFERIIVLMILAKVILSYFMDPFHPIRRTVDQLVNPLLDPIRRLLPTMGGIDFSPIILIILIQLVFSLLRNILI
ncbi:MAG: YggT family protein [Anaerolineales bacterium]|nr:YggT family protein [Anaerolineales bacterium]MBS3751897.1 YggT family protein [Anaerolineales bacterium]